MNVMGGRHHSAVVGASFACLAEVDTAVEHLHRRCSDVSMETATAGLMFGNASSGPKFYL